MGKTFRRPEALTDIATHYCPGCTHGVIHRLIAEVIDELNIQGHTVGVAPGGCAVLAYNYFNFDFQEAAHGRAPTTMPGQRTTTSPFGRDVDQVGMPVKMAELLAALPTTAYVTRQSVIKPKYINRARKAIRKAFELQMRKVCYSFVEVVSTCPTNWGMTPLEAVAWTENTLLSYYPIGDCKSPNDLEVLNAN